LAKSCLLSDDGLDLKPYLRKSATDLRNALQQVIDGKPSQHQLSQKQHETAAFCMASIGG